MAENRYPKVGDVVILRGTVTDTYNITDEKGAPIDAHEEARELLVDFKTKQAVVSVLDVIEVEAQKPARK